MIISLRQDDGTTERVSTGDLSALEAAAIEGVVGVPWRVVEDRLRAQDVTAMRAVLWVVRRRDDPALEFATFDIPGWRHRLRARIERDEIDEMLTNVMREALAKSEDSTIDALQPHLRKLADNPADVESALDDLGKGHLVRRRTE
ncbi:hypothetical protein ABZX40_28340 [Streptomyces sp. NPDC004610]|uniref:hypothetical protein n=1 Tax=unclassified Streptomyces TaxID=2593676 RepID=UPI0033A1BFCD